VPASTHARNAAIAALVGRLAGAGGIGATLALIRFRQRAAIETDGSAFDFALRSA
jgi:hypothetical protein